ncbi:bifunctional phosphoglucose/phosphomannose isomerase [Thermosediminibacter litoriperuensis]|uniref:Bifunctional phosphoglucose/phosphomannose isomerase n=1 Tax=Thermosediminibacter litoriperuensis TaxID=291989 RepID=A0A5S5AUX9_9FIRM|nr:bifunctional phosphoglucose/phosphomannose isomerase [Thermosediminibacter litoriperuensis]TYP56690.1 bifunctional phosphoglucose/phosphomannose isomerase [Thermosediminibacter litoriperuensis]
MLDKLENIRQLDKSGMFDLIYGLADQCEEAVKIARESVKGLRFYNIVNVVITGLGGSAIGGDLVRMLAGDTAALPIMVNRDYSLPSFVDEKTLVIASSYSGNTEETLAAYDEAVKKKARIVAITTGGELKKKAMADEIPVITIPPGLPPRAAIGYSFFPLLVLLEELGIIHNCTVQIPGAIELMREVRDELAPEVPEEKNPAKALARKIHGKLPVIYGSQGVTDALAVRWKGQINENGKHPAFFNVFPELNHNEIMGFEGDPGLLKEVEIVILRSPEENDRVKKRIEITSALIRDKVSGISEVWPAGDSRLERIMYHVIYGDYVSAYLAVLNEKDPTEIDFINILKERMKG